MEEDKYFGKFSMENVPNLFKINYDSKGLSRDIAKHIRKKKKKKKGD